MKRNILIIVLSFCLAVINSGCASNEIGESKDVNQETIYQTYHISHTEGDELVTITAQFRFAGENGTTLVLNKPGGIKADDKIMAVDSTEMEGSFYKTTFKINGFYGKHRLVFTDINNKKMENEFSFDAFSLINIPPIAFKDEPLQIAFDTTPLTGDDYIEVHSADTDSSFSVIHLASDANNFITIPAKELRRQKGSSITLEIKRYKKTALQQQTKEGGLIEIEQTLKPVKIQLANEIKAQLVLSQQ